MNLGKILRKVVRLRPLLKILGVKDKTVAAKVGEGLAVVDKALGGSPDETLKPRGDEGVALLFAAVLILVLMPVIALIGNAFF